MGCEEWSITDRQRNVPLPALERVAGLAPAPLRRFRIGTGSQRRPSSGVLRICGIARRIVGSRHRIDGRSHLAGLSPNEALRRRTTQSRKKDGRKARSQVTPPALTGPGRTVMEWEGGMGGGRMAGWKGKKRSCGRRARAPTSHGTASKRFSTGWEKRGKGRKEGTRGSGRKDGKWRRRRRMRQEENTRRKLARSK